MIKTIITIPIDLIVFPGMFMLTYSLLPGLLPDEAVAGLTKMWAIWVRVYPPPSTPS